VEQLLRELDLHHRFDVIIDSHHAGFEKPDPAIFAAALTQLGVEPSSAVYIGDFYAIDVLGARAAGVEAILLDPLGITLEADCLVIRSLEELREILAMHR
jgi:putative hydrolase of the HAD superfamily